VNHATGDKQPGRLWLAILLAVVGVLALALAALYFFDASALPAGLEGRSHHGHHLIRVVISLAIAIACLIGSLLAARSKSYSPPASMNTGADPAAAAAPAASPAPDNDPWPDSGTAQWQGSGEQRQESGPGSGAAGPG